MLRAVEAERQSPVAQAMARAIRAPEARRLLWGNARAGGRHPLRLDQLRRLTAAIVAAPRDASAVAAGGGGG
jgi:hypothetical protein